MERSLARGYVTKALGFGGGLPDGGVQFGSGVIEDDLAQQEILFAVSGSQLEARRRPVKGARDWQVALARHHPERAHTDEGRCWEIEFVRLAHRRASWTISDGAHETHDADVSTGDAARNSENPEHSRRTDPPR